MKNINYFYFLIKLKVHSLYLSEEGEREIEKKGI